MSNQLFLTQDGSHSIFSEQFGVSYHSKYGAIQETQHVFIDAALRYKAVSQKEIAVLDIGFGTGLNAYMTLLEAINRDLTINYTAYEAFPITTEQAGTLNYAQLLETTGKEMEFLPLHTAPWEQWTPLHPNFSLFKCLQSFHSIKDLEQYDVIYFDAFAPSAQPDLWEFDLLSKMYKALKPEGVFVTYCAKGAVKRTLKAAGFLVERLKGPPGKREMTRAVKAI